MIRLLNFFGIAMLCTAASLLNAADVPEWKQAFVPEGDDWKAVDQHLRFNNGTEPESLDPQLIAGVPESRLASGLFEGLVGLHPIDLSPVPALAERWTIDEAGLVYTFYLRKNAQWSDGTAIDANTVLASWQRLLTPIVAAEYVYQIYPVANAEAIFKQEKPMSELGVTVVDAHTLQVTLHQPCPWFLELAAFHTLYPVPTHVIDKHGDQWTRPEHLVSSGPFTLSEWQPRQFIKMSKNPKYWDAAFVKLDTITAYPYDELNTALALFENGELDWMPGVPQEKIDELRQNPDYYVMPYLGVYFYRFNVTKPPFDNPLVRKALTMAIDREVITKHITKAGQLPVSYWCPPMGDYKPQGGLEYDRDAARKLLADAGYPNGEGFPATEIYFNTSEAHKAIAENVAQQWQENLGIQATTRNNEWKTYLAELRNLSYSVARSAWIGDYNDPNTFYDCFVSGGGNNRTGWSNDEYDKLLAESHAILDPAERHAKFARMEEILLKEECAIAPIYNYVYQGLVAERVFGFEHNLRDIHLFQYMWLE